MKKIYSLLVLGLLGAIFAAVPMKSFATQLPAAAADSTSSDALVVTYNENSSINGAQYTGTLADGSVLGFNIYFDDYYYMGYNNEYIVYFCGAISSASFLSVPEKISYNGTEFSVRYCGYNSDNTLDFDEATSVSSLTLPATITQIRNYIPSSITDLHLLSETPPSYNYSSNKYITSFTTVWVPKTAYSAYQSLTTNSNSNWYNLEVHYEGWTFQSYTINVSTPGNFAYEIQNQVSQWTDVDALKVTGSLNTEEMELFSRFSQLQTLDLSQTNIQSITGCHGLTKLTTVLLPSTVTGIGNSAFSGCVQLNSINTPNVVTVGNSAFYNCSALTSIDLPKATEIGSEAFRNSGLTSIALPTAKTIGSVAFSSCSNLTSVSIPEAETLGTASSSSYSYGSGVFSNTAITEISLPKVLYLSPSCFYRCYSLQTVTLAEGLKEIPYYCFLECSKLTTINFPTSLKTIGNQALRGTALTSVILPEGLQTLDYYAFEYCPLTTISLPSTIQDINSDAFYGCSNVKDVYCYAIAPPNTTAFTGTNWASATLHVPAFSLTNYMFHENWYRFNQTLPIEGNLTDLIINQTFNIANYTGLADKVNLNLASQGHLTVNGGSSFNLNTFTQELSNSYTESWNSSTQSYIYTYPNMSTLITNNEVKADNVSLRLKVKTNRWHFISFPFDVNVADIEYPAKTLWVIRKYSGADRAALTGNTWQNMTNGTTLQAGEGYILHCGNDSISTVEFVFHAVNNAKKNNLFAYSDVVKPLNTYASDFAHNRSWNLVGNPYPAYFDIRNIEHNGVITVYNNSTNYSSSGNYYGSYTAYSLIDDDYILRPNEAFFVQCPNGASSMKFKAEGRTHEYNGNEVNGNNTTRAPREFAAPKSKRQVYNLTLSNASFTDRARLVINPDAEMDYEISCDASKFMSDNPSVPQLYVYDQGIRYAIDERPKGDGVIALGARYGQPGEYTLALKSAPAANESITLTDHETGQQVNLAEETYSFTAQAGTSESRFTLEIGGDVTGIDEIANSPLSNDPSLYDLQGRKANAQHKKGIYILKQNGKSSKVLK